MNRDEYNLPPEPEEPSGSGPDDQSTPNEGDVPHPPADDEAPVDPGSDLPADGADDHATPDEGPEPYSLADEAPAEGDYRPADGPDDHATPDEGPQPYSLEEEAPSDQESNRPAAGPDEAASPAVGDSADRAADEVSADSYDISPALSGKTRRTRRRGAWPNESDDDPLAGSRMSFGEHLDELRTCLLRAIYGILIGFAVCLYFGNEIFAFLAHPLLIALEWAQLETSLYVTSLPESFITYIKVCFISAIFLTSPWVFYQLWKFVAAGLYRHERQYVYSLVPFSAVLFLLGGAFFMFIVAPISCSFFIRFSMKFSSPEIANSRIYRWLAPAMQDQPDEKDASADTAANGPPPEKSLSAEMETLLQLLVEKQILTEPEAARLRPGPAAEPAPGPSKSPAAKGNFVRPWFTLQSYVSLIIVLALAFGAAFQMPLVVFFLGRLKIVPLKTFRSSRKYVFFALVIVAALMTPPDVISQIALALPMYVLYELGILMVWIWPAPRIR
ncbi:MAG: twin-arginine translocase subunit TatC [Sedimentisphaerales bacterium]|nr:twin-arginine translocase subunit TatC [Sedimentisphaerales bacterium]